jgi:hypothetical protein
MAVTGRIREVLGGGKYLASFRNRYWVVEAPEGWKIGQRFRAVVEGGAGRLRLRLAAMGDPRGAHTLARRAEALVRSLGLVRNPHARPAAEALLAAGVAGPRDLVEPLAALLAAVAGGATLLVARMRAVAARLGIGLDRLVRTLGRLARERRSPGAVLDALEAAAELGDGGAPVLPVLGSGFDAGWRRDEEAPPGAESVRVEIASRRLGRVGARLSLRGGGLRVDLAAERSEAGSRLEEAAPDLRRELAEEGYPAAAVTVGRVPRGPTTQRNATARRAAGE